MNPGNIAIRAGDATKSGSALIVALVIKASAGRLYTISVHNTGASTAYLMLFDAVSVPANGAVAPFCYKVAADSSVQLHWGDGGRGFGSGIVAVMSSTATSKTLASAEHYIDATYH